MKDNWKIITMSAVTHYLKGAQNVEWCNIKQKTHCTLRLFIFKYSDNAFKDSFSLHI